MSTAANASRSTALETPSVSSAAARFWRDHDLAHAAGTWSSEKHAAGTWRTTGLIERYEWSGSYLTVTMGAVSSRGSYTTMGERSTSTFERQPMSPSHNEWDRDAFN